VTKSVFVYVESLGEVQSIKYAFSKRYNPGIGGTTFQQLRLFHELQQNLRWSVDLIGLADEYIDLEPYHCSLLKFSAITAFGEVEPNGDQTLIINSGGLKRYYKEICSLKNCRVLIWLHHPFDHKTISMGRSLHASFVSCGKYQFISNWLLGAHDHYHIYNFYYEEAILQQGVSAALPAKPKSKGEFRIGYWGALDPSKGFHHVAKSWNQISRELKSKADLNATLFVIGKEYSFSSGERSSSIPTTSDYAQTILNCFECNNNIPPNVSFLGRLSSPHSVVRDFDLIITNPAGTGEAFSQVVLEIFSLRVPAVISSRYGMSDFASCVPELSISSPSRLASVVLRYASLSESRKMQIIDKQFVYAKSISLLRDESLNQWASILLQSPGKRKQRLFAIFGSVNHLALLLDVVNQLLIQLRKRLRFP